MHDRNNGTDYYLSKLGKFEFDTIIKSVKCPFCLADENKNCITKDLNGNISERYFPHISREIKFEQTYK